jgi:hypothetical protein
MLACRAGDGASAPSPAPACSSTLFRGSTVTSRSPIAFLGSLAVLVTLSAPASAQQQCPATRPGDLPLKYSGGATVPAITACDLMTRLYIYSDDSLLGREVGTDAHRKATAYIEREVRRLGLQPAGDSGGYFQNIPVVARGFDTASTVTVAPTVYHGGVDFIAQSAGKVHQLADVPTMYVGAILDTLTVLPPEQTRGKLLIFLPPGPGTNAQAIEAQPGFQRWYQMWLNGAGRAIVAGPHLPPPMVQAATTPSTPAMIDGDAPIELLVTVRLAEAMLGDPLGSATNGKVGRPVTTRVRFVDQPRPGRNVVAILPGSDPGLSHEYVAIGAHNDHIGVADSAVDHDSLKVFNEFAQPQGADGEPKQLSAEEWRRVNTMIDSLHKLHGGPRADSIYNGADDDGSGTVSLLEIAEAFAKGSVKPKRSILFIWHAGEEKGLWGSEYFTDHPTVPRESIVAELNMDMVGRGQPTDATGTTKSGELIHGSANYLQLIGSRRLSTELGDIVEQVNKESGLGFTFDYALDADGHPQNIYCRSDHAEYARYGIPIVFFTTGGHADYHQVTDEPQYIQYVHMVKVDELVFDIARKVADLPHRVVVDKPKPDPHGTCKQ